MARSPLIALLVLSIALVSTVSAADTGTTTTGATTPAVPTPTTQATETPLLLTTVTASDAKSVTLVFNQAIQIESLRVRIIDQATNESVKIASITGSLDPMTAVINTAGALTAGASYVLTITSALSTTEMTINAGIDSIREFAVPVTLPGASLNAPANPTAVIVATGTTTVTPAPVTQSGSATGAIVLPQDTEALPATGTPTTILIILAAISALALLLVRKRA